MNKVNIMGRLTRDIELKSTQGGVSVCSFAVAVDRAYKPKDGEREVDFINCVAWRQTAEFISKWFGKGRMIAVSGSLQTRKYEKDGQKRTVTEVIVDQAYFCGDKGERRDNELRDMSYTVPPPEFADIGDDDVLPF